MKKQTSKIALRLTTETVRTLQATELQQVAGGGIEPHPRTYGCPVLMTDFTR